MRPAEGSPTMPQPVRNSGLRFSSFEVRDEKRSKVPALIAGAVFIAIAIALAMISNSAPKHSAPPAPTPAAATASPTPAPPSQK